MSVRTLVPTPPAPGCAPTLYQRASRLTGTESEAERTGTSPIAGAHEVQLKVLADTYTLHTMEWA